MVQLNWEGISAFIGVLVLFGGGMFWVLKQTLQNSLDERYQGKDACQAVHKITDTMFKAMRDDVTEIKDAVVEIRTAVIDALTGGNGLKRRRRKQ